MAERMRRCLAAAALIVALAGGAEEAGPFPLHVGMTRAEVVERIGQPDESSTGHYAAFPVHGASFDLQVAYDSADRLTAWSATLSGPTTQTQATILLALYRRLAHDAIAVAGAPAVEHVTLDVAVADRVDVPTELAAGRLDLYITWPGESVWLYRHKDLLRLSFDGSSPVAAHTPADHSAP